FIFGVHTKTTEEIKEYANLDAVLEDFATSDLEYKKAAAIFAQNPRPSTLKIGKRVANVKQKNNVAIDTAASGDYTVVINGTDFTYNAGGGDVAADIVDGLIAAIGGGSEPVTTTDNGNDFDIEADVAGVGFTISLSDHATEMTLTEPTPNTNVVTEIARIQLIDNDR
ncbi:unnamed protein product, partial [marine sediment metagenome]